jgi:putative two-component system response regulator
MPETVLFVDDEQNILNTVEREFSNVPVRLLTCSSAEEAMKIIKDNEIAVIVSDNLMPGITGIDFLAWAKNTSPESMRILMTGHADLPTAISAINRGEVYRFITKPWDTKELIDIVLDSINKYRIIVSLKSADEAKLLSLAQTVELKDPYTKGHCERVASFSIMIADAMGLNEDIKQLIKYGSWLHDCGKIGVPEDILKKPGRLDRDQFEIVKKHCQWGADVVQKARLHDTVLKIALYHHEKYNGTGYPCGLAADNIPFEARIVAIADTFDAITTDRPYRKKYPEDKAVELIRSEKNISFDPVLVDIFIKALANDRQKVTYGN